MKRTMLFIIMVVNSTLAVAQTTSWRGTVSTAWENAANWTNGVPTATVGAVLGDGAATRQPTISSAVTVASISFRSTAAITLTIGTGGSLTVLGDVSGTWNANRRHTIAIGTQSVLINGSFSSGTNNLRRINVTLTTGTLNIRGNYLGTGQLTFNGAGYLYIGGNYTATGAFTRGTGTVTYDGTGNQTVRATTYYNLVVNKTAGTANLTGATTVAGNFTVSQGTLNLGANTLTVSGNNMSFTVNGTITGTGAITLSGTNQQINGTGTISSTGNLSLTTGAKTILPTANLTIASPIILGSATVAVTVTNNGTITSTSASGITASLGTTTWVNGENSILNVAGPLLTTGTLTADATPNTVNYNGTAAAQIVKATTYHNLTITKGTQTATLGGAITVNGNLTIASGTLAASTYAMTLNGNFSNAGTFNGNSGSVTMAGTNATISGTGAYNFNTLTVTGDGVTVDPNTTLIIADNLTTSGAGSFVHIPGGSGMITMTGTAKSINGDNIKLDDLNVTGSVTMDSSIGMAGNLTVSGSFTGATGTTLTMIGDNSTISGAGTISLSSLSVLNTIGVTSNVQINQNLSGGTIIATNGTFTFNGAPSLLSGTANLYNVVVSNGATLRLTTNSQLGIANALTLTGTLDAVNGGVPNTVVYNGTGAQTVVSTTYHNLTLTNGNTKTANGALTVNGNLTIGSGTTFSAGTYTHTVQGNWTNNGTFTAGSCTVQLTGSTDATIGGSSATTFNILTINKTSSTNTITLASNVTVGTVNLTSGNITTGTNSITITNTRTGNGYIIGTITRTHTYVANTAYAFESPYNTVTFSTVGSVTSITITVTIGAVSDFPFGGSINRQYAISVTGSGYTATLRLHYLDEELNGNIEASMQLWRYNGTQWVLSGKTANDETNNWVEQSGLTNITNRWTISDDQNVVRWNGSTSSSWSVAANWTAVQGAPSLPPASGDIVQLGTASFTNQPTITTAVTVKNIVFGSAQAVTLTIGSGGSLTTSGINGQWTANAVHTIDVGSQSLTIDGDIALSDGTANHSINLTVGSGTVTINGVLNQSGTASVSLGSGTLTLRGNYNYSGGTFTAGTSTVLYNGPSDQSVAGVSYYNLVLGKTGGTANLNNPATVNGSLTLNTGGTFAVNAALTVVGNVSIGASTVMNANASTITVGGNWIRVGTFTAGTSTVVFNGSTNQTIDGTTFNNLTINKPSGTATLTASSVIAGNLTVQSGVLDIANYTMNRSALGGTFTLAGNATLRLSGANNFPANYATYTLSPTSTVEYYGTLAQTVQGGLSYGNLTINKSGSTATLGNSLTVAGDLTIQPTSTLNGSSYTLTLQGNWNNNGTFTPSTGTVQLAGTNKTIAGSVTTFNNLTVTGSYTSTTDMAVNGALTVAGTGSLSMGTTTLTIVGNLSNNGTLSSAGVITFAGTQAQTIAMNAGFLSTGTVNFNGTVAPTFAGSSPPTFNTLNINNTAGISPTTGWVVNGVFTVASGAKFYGGAATHTFKGNFTNNGIITSSGVLKFEPTTPVTLTLLGSPVGTSFTSTGTVEFGGTGALTIVAPSPNIYTLTISNTNPAGVTLPAGWTIQNDLNITSGATLNGSTLTYTVNGSITNFGTFNAQSSTVRMTGNGEAITGSGTTFNNLVIAAGASIDLNSDISITRDLTVNGTFNLSTHSVTFSGSTPSLISGSANPVTLTSLVIEKTAATTTLGQNVDGILLLHIKSGALDLSTFTLTQDVDGGELRMEAGSTLRIQSAAGVPAFESYDLDDESIVEYYGSSAQTVTPIEYGSLLFTGSGAKTIAADILAKGNCTIASGTPLALSGAITFTVNGNWTDDGTFTAGSGTVVLGGSGKTINGTTTFTNLRIDGTITNTGTVTVNGGFTGTGSFAQATNALLTLNGTPLTVAAMNASAEPNTVIYAGTAAQNLIPGTYYNLILRNGGMKTAASNISVNNNLTIELGARFTINNGIVVQVLGRTETYGELNNYGSLLITD